MQESRIDIPMKLLSDQKGGGKVGDEILVHSSAQAEYMASKGLAEFVNKDDEKAAKGAYEAANAEQAIDPHMTTDDAPTVTESAAGVTSTASVMSEPETEAESEETTTTRKPRKKHD